MAKIIIFDGTLLEGGAERVISLLSRELSDQNNSVEIVIFKDTPAFYSIDPRVKITSVEKTTKSKNLFKNILWLRKHFNNSCDFIISFLAPFNMIAIVASLGLKKPIIVADRNDPRMVPQNFIIRKARDFLYRYADCVVVQTYNNKEYFSNKIKKKTVVIYNPADVGAYKGIALNTDKNNNKIVSVGRLIEQKNQVLLIRAFNEIHKKYPLCILYIYGEGEERRKLEQLILKHKLNNCVFLPGTVSDLFEQEKDASMFILTSNYEGMPNALIEAMCIGLPVISTKVSGATDLIKNGKNGILIDINNETQLIEAISKIYENKSYADNLASNAVKLNDKLELSKIGDKWLKVINRFI